MRGYFAIGIEHTKTVANVGTLMRSAHNMGAAYVFTIGRRYKKQASDTIKAWSKIPLFHYETFDDFKEGLPFNSLLIGIELTPKAAPLSTFIHPERSIYLLGAEDYGLSKAALSGCHKLVQIDGCKACLNVSVAGSIVMYDRMLTRQQEK